MQHLDEGMIHSWLDGALAPDEAARVQTHVAECAECASAVAEARGFIAASSRILTKLDDVPSGVVPIARPVRRRNIAAWQAAAAMLVVAVGSLVVLKSRDSEPAVATSQRAAAVEVMSDSGQADTRLNAVQPQAVLVPRNTPVVPGNTSARPTVAKAMPAPPRDERRADHPATVGSAEGAQANAVAAAAPAAPFAADARTESPLRLLKEEKVIGGTRTLYAVAPADTVTLFEPVATQLQSVVTTDAAGPMERRSISPPSVSELSAQASSGVADTAALMGKLSVTAQGRAMKSSAGAAAALPAPAAPPVSQVKPLRSITWTDATSGRTLTLSGRLPAEQLEDIKRRIERERAAAAAARKPTR